MPILRAVCVLALAVAPSAAHAQRGTTAQDEWLARFNRERERAGVSLLRRCPVLDQVAQAQAEEMAGQEWWMRSPPPEVVATRLQQVGYAAHAWHEMYRLWSPTRGVISKGSSDVVLDERFRDLGVGTAVTADGGTLQIFYFGWHKGDYFASATARLADRARIAAEMLARVNDVRRRAGLAPLAANPLLDRVSQQHAEDMLTRSYFGHRSPEGLGPSDRARADGYRSGIGENIVEQRFSTEEALSAWLESPAHRRNILDPGCTELGVGLAVGAGYDAAPGGYRVIWVQSFGRGS